MESNPSEPRSRRLSEWHRDWENRKIAGVCAGISAQMEWPVTGVRAGFVLLTVFPHFHALGIWLYLVLWALMPATPGARSLFDRLVDGVNDLFTDRPHEPREPRGYEPGRR